MGACFLWRDDEVHTIALHGSRINVEVGHCQVWPNLSTRRNPSSDNPHGGALLFHRHICACWILVQGIPPRGSTQIWWLLLRRSSVPCEQWRLPGILSLKW